MITADSFLSLFPEFSSSIPDASPPPSVKNVNLALSTDRYIASFEIAENVNAIVSYVKLDSANADRGHWRLRILQLENPFSKTIGQLRYSINDDPFFNVVLNSDSSVTNVLGFKSATALGSDPLTGADPIPAKLNIIFSDSTLAYTETQQPDPPERLRFESFKEAVLGTFKAKQYMERYAITEYSQGTIDRIEGLLVAHIACIVFLSKEAGGNISGDEQSISWSSGGVNFSTSRIQRDQFLRDPYLSRTRYGSELAFYLRKSGPGIITLGSDSASIKPGELE